MDGDKMRQCLGRRIQEIRDAHNETQQALADKLGVNRQVIKTWETGTRHIKAHDLIALADHFDCTIDFLVGRSDNPTRDKDMQEICDYTGLSQWSIEELRECKNDTEKKEYIETINALLENKDFFHSMASNITRAAEAKTLWRMIHDSGVTVSDPDYWNETNRVLTVANVATEEYSPFNYAEIPNAQNLPVLLPTGSWFLTADDAAEFLVNRATELFRDIISEHLEKWNVWPNLSFAPGADGKVQVTISNRNSEVDNGEHQEN